MHQIDALAQRVGALERQNRRLKSIGILVGAATAAFFLMGQAALPGTLRTSRLDLVDATGTVRATLTTTYPSNATDGGPNLSRGAPSLTFYNRDESLALRVGITSGDDTPGVQAWGAGQGAVLTSSVSLMAQPLGGSLALNSGATLQSQAGVIMASTPLGEGVLLLTDGKPNGDVVWSAP